MISLDTNILLYAQNRECAEHTEAYEFIRALASSSKVVICELILVELYLLLRNPTVLQNPLSAKRAAEVCHTYRINPNWRLVENAPVMERVWKRAGQKNFARRKIIDVRLAFTLQHHGVTELATANVKDFQGLGFSRVWNPVV